MSVIYFHPIVVKISEYRSPWDDCIGQVVTRNGSIVPKTLELEIVHESVYLLFADGLAKILALDLD